MTGATWPCYVINLIDNHVRMDSVSQQLEGVGLSFERISAVNGTDLSPSEVSKVYDAAANSRQSKQDLVPGEIGCYLSHIAAWRRISDSTAPGGIVLEDDFQAAPDFADVVEALSANTSPDWDIAKLFCIDPNPDLISSQKLIGGYELARPFRVPSTTLGYAITRASARALLNQSRRFFRPIDEDHKFFWEHGQRIALVHPNPLSIGEQATVTGTIGSARRVRSKGHALRKLRYQLVYQLLLRWHRARGHQ